MFQFCATVPAWTCRRSATGLEINDVLIGYTRAIDTGDWDRLDTVFTPDAQIDYTESGGIAAAYAEVKPWLAEMLPAFFPKRMHTLGQVEIRLRGDRPRSRRTSTTRCRWTTARAARRSSRSAGSTTTR